jgi:hypothetical protein
MLIERGLPYAGRQIVSVGFPTYDATRIHNSRKGGTELPLCGLSFWSGQTAKKRRRALMRRMSSNCPGPLQIQGSKEYSGHVRL